MRHNGLETMYFTKYPHPANFSYAEAFESSSATLTAGTRTFNASIAGYEGDVYHVSVTNADLWAPNRCLASLEIPAESDRRRLKASGAFELSLLGKDGKQILRSVPGRSFGVSGPASLFSFEVPQGTKFYGMGQKFWGKYELSGRNTKFWTTDVWGDFDYGQFIDRPADPPYFVTPYVVLQIGSEFVGLLLHNPYPTFIFTPHTEGSEHPHTLTMGSEDGEANLWVIYGTSLADVTRKLQNLVGVTPLPPIWALGYHQCRWGYEGEADMLKLDAEFAKHQIPCDAFWMDLEHMRGFRIFNTSKEAFPKGAQATVDAMAANDRKIVPILDPGVKLEPGLNVYDDGHEKKVFCENAEGKEYVGLVWPGETVFPDFSLPETRKWWAGWVKNWFDEGYSATWVDMNDPSTGWVDPTGMLFQHGKAPHTAYHNQFALGMQMATFDGFRAAKPNERGFMLSRSGFTGTSKYSAVWTGDNASNYFYLRISIPTALGMSLSGLPFSGPDMGGFGEDCWDQLMVDWVKTQFLFPFCRNHSSKGTRDQEPYAFKTSTLSIVRRYIRLRYKLIPYLYNLFIDQEQVGDPILRPLNYHFDDADLHLVDDEFMIGDSILQAPFVWDDRKTREVRLPGSDLWYDARTGEWVPAGTVNVSKSNSDTPLFVRAGAIIPMQHGTPKDNKKELRKVCFHIFVPEGWSGERTLLYRADDGISFDYQKGKRSEISITVVAKKGNVSIQSEQTADGFGDIVPTFVIHSSPNSVRYNGMDIAVRKGSVVLTGKSLPVKVLA